MPVRTPRLVELFDTAPYLHDGRALSLSNVFTQGTTHVRRTAGISAQERSDLMTYLLALDKNNTISDSASFTGQPSFIGQFGSLIALPENDSKWEYCANEGEVCEVPEGATIRYGANGVYHYIHNQSGEVNCSNLRFGDALYGTVKQCEYFLPNEIETAAEEFCFPIKAKSGNIALICL